MRSLGIVRKIDNLGRLVIPKETRTIMNFPEGTPMEIFVEGDTIILRKYSAGCKLCGGMDNLKEFKGKQVCQACKKEMGD